LSPLLFALFTSDFEQKMGCRFLKESGVPLRVGGVVSHLFYADDLTLVSRHPDSLQSMLNRLSDYGRSKGLSINPAKSKLVVFNSVSTVSPAFRFEDQPLEVLDEFKYLGVLFHKSLSFDHADRQWSRALAAAIHLVFSLAKRHNVRHKLGLIIQLFQTYAISSGLYGSHIWASSFLSAPNVWNSLVESQHLAFLRRLVLARLGTWHWALLNELGQVPFQFFWWRAALKFWNCLLDSGNDLLLAAVKSDVQLAGQMRLSSRASCWTRDLLDGLKSLMPLDDEDDAISSARSDVLTVCPVDKDSILRRVWHTYSQNWRMFDDVQDFRVADVLHRKKVTFNQCFLRDEELPPRLPPYLLHVGLSRHEVIQNARFRLGSHNLCVERGRFDRPPIPWENRSCRRCIDESLGLFECAVDDEFHMVFDCTAFSDLRQGNIRNIIQRSNGSLRRFCEDADVVSVSHYISRCMDRVDDLVIGSAQQPAG
jgi:hypothetical protein